MSGKHDSEANKYSISVDAEARVLTIDQAHEECFPRHAKQIEELRLENEALAKELAELKERIESGGEEA